MLSTVQLEVIYNKYYWSCFRYALSVVGSVEDAQDITSDVFIRAYTKMKYIDITAEAFLIILTKNICWEFKKRVGKIKVLPLFEDVYLIEEYVGKAIIKEEVLKALDNSIVSLPLKCQQIFLLYMGGASTGDICAVMGISIQNALNQKTRAIKLIKQSIAKYYI